MRDALISSGLDRSFVSRAISHSSSQMWYPTTTELIAARAISGMVDGYKFAASGYGIRPGTENFAASLRKMSFYRAVEEVDPAMFAAVASQFQQRYVDGLPEGNIIDELRDTKVFSLVRSRLPNADDRPLIDFASLAAEQYEMLGAKDGKACYEYATKGGNSKIIEQLGPEMNKREVALSERVLRSNTIRSVSSSGQLEALYGKVFAKLGKQYSDADILLLVEPEKTKPAQYSKFCRMLASMFREVTRLPLEDAGSVLSEFFKEAPPLDKK